MIVTGRNPENGQPLQVTVSADAHDSIITDVTATSDTVDAGWLAPGLVDVQVNGFAGHDVNADAPTWENVAAITAALGDIGVTTWCPTVITASREGILERLRAIHAARQYDPATARAVPGVHIEGPFLSPADGARGVHDPTHIRPLDLEEVEQWIQVGVPIELLTVSPHRADTIASIPALVGRGITVALGHTDAEPDQISAATAAGATVSTHLGNGVPFVLPRHPNGIWTQLADDRLSAGLIADGHHLPFDVLEVMLRAKPADRAFLVSDSTELAGSRPGRYRTSVGGTVELEPNGRLSYLGTELLAGAALPITDGLVNVVTQTTFSLAQAVRLVTTNPARLLPSARPHLGQLTVGAPADLVLLNNEGAVQRVLVNGRWLDEASE